MTALADADHIADHLLPWYEQYGRKQLPWQRRRDPYLIWLSEIMLQQTQVATVIPYYERFVAHFPTLTDLAHAELESVLHLWTGLGYYARARRLHQTAQLIQQQHDGVFPRTVDELIALPGIGRSTAGAIVAAAFGRRAAILDGNVKRVLARFHAIAEPVDNTNIKQQLWEIATHYTPKRRVRAYNQAMMDLGATVCKRQQPQCQICPLQTDCEAYQQDKVQAFPVIKKKKKLPKRHAYFLLLIDGNNQLLLEKRAETGLWGGLWCLPQCELDVETQDYCSTHYGLQIVSCETQTAFKHSFTHFHLYIQPLLCHVKRSRKRTTKNIQWIDPSNPPAIGLAKPVVKLIQQLVEQQHD